MKRQFSRQQLNYAAARALFDLRYQASRDYDLVMDAECQRLGIETPYGILPDGHPMWAQAQKLLDQENAARKLMYEAAANLFDWATGETFKRCGTPEQHKSIREMVVKVKAMAHVEKPFEELVSMSMRLVAP